MRGVAGGDAVYGYGFYGGHTAGGVRKGEGLDLELAMHDGDGRLGGMGKRRTDAFGSRSTSTIASYSLVFNWGEDGDI